MAIPAFILFGIYYWQMLKIDTLGPNRVINLELKLFFLKSKIVSCISYTSIFSSTTLEKIIRHVFFQIFMIFIK